MLKLSLLSIDRVRHYAEELLLFTEFILIERLYFIVLSDFMLFGFGDNFNAVYRCFEKMN